MKKWLARVRNTWYSHADSLTAIPSGPGLSTDKLTAILDQVNMLCNQWDFRIGSSLRCLQRAVSSGQVTSTDRISSFFFKSQKSLKMKQAHVGHGQGQGTERANKKQSVMDQWLAWQNTSIQHTRNFSPCILTLSVIGWETLCPLFNLLEHWAPPRRRSITATGLRSLGAIIMGFKNLDKENPEKETGPPCLWKQNIAFKSKAKLAASVLGETSNKEKGPG